MVLHLIRKMSKSPCVWMNPSPTLRDNETMIRLRYEVPHSDTMPIPANTL